VRKKQEQHHPILWRRKILNVFILLLLFTFSSEGQLKELQLKAMFLEAAIRFVTWPIPEINDSTGGIPSTEIDATTFTIGVFKDDPITPYLHKVFDKKSVKDAPVKFLTIKNPESLSHCDLILIPDNRKISVTKIIDKTRHKPILTVSENPAFLENGVILSITIEHRKIECHINKAEADSSGFKISHHLLKKSILFTPKNMHQ